MDVYVPLILHLQSNDVLSIYRQIISQDEEVDKEKM